MATAAEDILDVIRQNESDIFIGLYGAAGAGKSSLINTVNSILQGNGEYEETVFTAPDELMGGHTMQREPVELTDHITIADNRGWHEWTNETSLQTLADQIDGKNKLSGFVDWIDHKEETFTPGEKPVSNKVNCVAVVIKGTAGLDGLHGIESLLDKCYTGTGRRPIAVITHKDNVPTEEVNEIRKILVSAYGLAASRIFAAKNMTASDPELEPDTRMSLLKFLRACITDGIRGSKYHERKCREVETEFHNSLLRSEKKDKLADKEREQKRKDVDLETVFLEKLIVQRRKENVEKETKNKVELFEIEKATRKNTSKIWERNYLEMQKEWFKCSAEAEAKAKYKGIHDE